jgi:NAD(P)-dependent dehydrogenase (short-subunit alcohol dehydrogenase family)
MTTTLIAGAKRGFGFELARQLVAAAIKFACKHGEIVARDGFVFCDLTPA